MTEVIVCEDPARRKLKAIKPSKSAGPDDIPPKLLKLPEPVIVSPLTGLFSFCAHLGETFTNWKKARLNAVYKKDEADPNNYLTIIPRAPMGSESIAHEAEGRMGYWLRGHEGERNNCFSKIQLVGQKYRDKTTLASKTRFSRHCFGFQSWRFSLLVGYNI